MTIATVHAAVERLLNEALPGNTPRPSVSVTCTAPGSVELYLDGGESPLLRCLSLALIADVLGDDGGPEVIPGRGRYSCGEFADHFFLVRCPVTTAQQAELEEFGSRIVAELDK